MKYILGQPLSIHELGQRQNQEDSIYPIQGAADANTRLFLLCDGMGGHECGEVASRIVCEEVSKFIHQVSNPMRPFTDDLVGAAMQSMYNVLDANDTGGNRKMGTTMVMLYFQPGGVLAGHIGDSRYYHIRPATRQIMYRSKDHSLVTQLYEAGEIKRSEMATAKGKNIILRAVMPHQDHLEMPDLVHIKDVQPGDLFYMCSDGMLEQMSDEEILSIFCDDQLTLEQKREWLVNATVNNRDNHTAYLIEVQAVEHDAIDAAAIDDEQEHRESHKALMALEYGDEAVEQATQTPSNPPAVQEAYVAAQAEPTSVPPKDEAPQATPIPEPAPTSSPRVTRVIVKQSKGGNGKLYFIIGLLLALIVALLAGFFVLNNKHEEKPTVGEERTSTGPIVSPGTTEDHSGKTNTDAASVGRKSQASATTKPEDKSPEKFNAKEAAEKIIKNQDNPEVEEQIGDKNTLNLPNPDTSTIKIKTKKQLKEDSSNGN